jgi:serine/threonine-protein kinase
LVIELRITNHQSPAVSFTANYPISEIFMSKPSWIGQTLGKRYDIRELLGQGGMSAVYKAYDPNLRRVVAVKLIHAHLSSDPEFVRRFQEEGAAVAQLRHNNIIQVYDFNHDGDTYFIVFEFIPGESLQARLKRLAEDGRQMPFEQTVEIAASTADALDYAHSRSMIHRDIKPANVMLNVQGQAILMDFGIVKIMGGDSHTATGAVLGTARYMAPEQIRGVQVDGRADIYSVGVMLFEMLSGNPPFKADSAMTLMMMHVNDPIPDLRTLRPDVPADLVRIVNRALSKDPAQRYQNAGELARDLRSARLVAPPPVDATQIEQAATSRSPVGATIIEPSPARQATTGYQQAPGTTTGATIPPAAPPTAVKAEPAEEGNKRGALIFGGIAIVLIAILCLAVGAFALNALGGEDGEETPIAAEQTETAEAAEGTPTAEIAAGATAGTLATDSAPEPTDTVEPTATLEPTNTPSPSPTSEPTETAIPSATPTATRPPGPFVAINGIALENGRYIVDFETIDYDPVNPGMHVHFFFNTVPPAQAGVGPNQGTWFVYYDASPFTGYGTADKPAEATQMCSLVANANHTIILDTGNCVNLPVG